MLKFALCAALVIVSAGCATTASEGERRTSLSQTGNVELARKMYADFGKGDIDAVLAAMSDDVVWIIPGPSTVPYAGVRTGKTEWMDYLKGLGTTEIEAFEPREFIADGDKVIVLGTERLRVKSTGRIAEEDWAQVLTFRSGKLIRFRSYDDTAAAAAAFAGSP